MFQNIGLPTIFQVNENILNQIPFFLGNINAVFNKILVVSGKNKSFHFATEIINSMKSEHYIVEDNSLDTIENLKDYCLSNRVDLIMGVGGGTVLDVVKRVSFLTDLPNFLVPTIMSNDGLMSPISVIKDHDGKTLSVPGNMPFGIVVDINILRNAPHKYLQSAAGDMLSNISATNDWVISSMNTGEKINDLAYMLSRNAAFALIQHESKDLRHRNFLKQVVHGQINSGLAMALAGTSRPCSGSEHLISHAIDFFNLSEETLHGLQVGSISIFSLYLQKKLDIKCINYANELNIPLAFHQLDDKIFSKLNEIYETSMVMRPGRYSVLNSFQGMAFTDIYQEFLFFLERFKVFDGSTKTIY